MHKEITDLCERAPKQRWINRFKVAPGCLDADFTPCGGNKEHVNVAGCRPLNGKWFSPMPRYFFNTRIGDEVISDPEGELLRDPDQAWEIARAMIAELLKLEGAQGDLLNASLEVTDDAGEIVLEFPFTEALLDMPDEPVTKH